MNAKPFVWQMVKEAVEKLGGKTNYSEIRKYILDTYGDVNENTITCQIIVCTVNHTSRIHYPENKKPRMTNTQYDFLFTTGRGQVEFYDPDEHGIWEIRKNEYGKLIVAQSGIEDIHESDDESCEDESEMLFPVESHLRDFIAQNIETIQINGKSLKLFLDEYNRDGIEYPTEVGPIDILAVDENGTFIVFELKLSRGMDRALGQILRYMGWIKANLAQGKSVKGVIVAKAIDQKLKYATSITPNISLFEYVLDFKIQQVSLD
ncbi:endonuclease NucS domain-containing protein [Acidobacteriota bacterium]